MRNKLGFLLILWGLIAIPTVTVYEMVVNEVDGAYIGLSVFFAALFILLGWLLRKWGSSPQQVPSPPAYRKPPVYRTYKPMPMRPRRGR